MTRIALAYSGGFAASVAIPWLAEQDGAEIITVTLDLGQGSALADVRERALAAGALRAHVLDVRDAFARDVLALALRAGATSERSGPLATALGRPLIAKHLVEVAAMEGAPVIAHACAGTDGDAARMDRLIRALDPAVTVRATAHAGGTTRPDAVAYARAHGVTVPVSAERACRVDENMWGRELACDALEDAWVEPPEDLFRLTRPASTCPETPASVEIRFEQGLPTEVNGVTLPLVELIASLETIAGVHGVGRVDRVVRRAPGTVSRLVGEAPAAVVLQTAHRDLCALAMPQDLRRATQDLARRYTDLVDAGRWFSPVREAIDAFMARANRDVSGVARLTLFKGGCRTVGRRLG